ncbi:MAG: hypothetical protein M3R17_06160 [Bacteroidota bacterium]|nr:hypothetical protein [Bacteroidota bacterium]
MIRLLIPLLLLFSFLFNERSNSGTNLCPDEKTSTDSILDSWLAKQAVENNIPQFKSLWLFVSVSELDSIEESHQLLRTYNYATHAQKEYYSSVTNSKFDRQPVATILRASDNLRIRDAWPSYWPIVNEEHQGDQLVQVFLGDSSLLVEFQPENKNPFTVYDTGGRIISLPEVMRRERHIAAVFMNSKGNGFSPADKKRVTVHQRSFFIVNEKMIRHWQHATPVMQDGILKDLKYLLLLEAWIKDNSAHTGKAGRSGKNILKSWAMLPHQRSVPEKVFACRRTSAAHDVTDADIQGIISAVRRLWPLQVKTMEKFPSKGIR